VHILTVIPADLHLAIADGISFLRGSLIPAIQRRVRFDSKVVSGIVS
jgi:hypothetical protein